MAGKKKRKRPLVIAIRLAAWPLALLVFWCGGMLLWINSYKPPLVLPQADAAIVLGAALWGDEPSPALRERLDHAFQIYEKGYFSSFIVTGGSADPAFRLTEAEGMRNYLQRLGVPSSAIALETASRSTYENLKFAKQVMDERQWTDSIIVTHDFHAVRASDIAAFLGMNAVVSGTKSRVLSYALYEAREVLAMSKWQLNKLRLLLD